TKAFLRLASEFNDPDGRRELLDSLNRAPKQQDAIIAFLQLIKTKNDVSRQDIMEVSGSGAGAITALIDKGVFRVEEKVVSRFEGTDVLLSPDFSFSPAQEQAFDEINNSFRSEEHTSELQSRENLVCRLLLEKKKKIH